MAAHPTTTGILDDPSAGKRKEIIELLTRPTGWGSKR